MITLVNSRLARIGYSFIQGEQTEECKECKLKSTCIGNLEKGRRYRITEIKNIDHDCIVVGKVKVVEVEEEELLLYVSKKVAIPGVTIGLEGL